jgi:hypothetical protein
MSGGQVSGGCPDLIVVYSIASRLGKFAHEVLEMPASEIDGWLSFIAMENERNK